MDYDRLSMVFSVSNLCGPRSIFLRHNKFVNAKLDYLFTEINYTA